MRKRSERLDRGASRVALFAEGGHHCPDFTSKYSVTRLALTSCERPVPARPTLSRFHPISGLHQPFAKPTHCPMPRCRCPAHEREGWGRGVLSRYPDCVWFTPWTTSTRRKNSIHPPRVLCLLIFTIPKCIGLLFRHLQYITVHREVKIFGCAQ